MPFMLKPEREELRMVLKHGMEFPTAVYPLPKGFPPGRKHDCFNNSQTQVIDICDECDTLIYVEGVASWQYKHRQGEGLCGHAWLYDAESRKTYDLTWSESLANGSCYFGVPISTSAMTETAHAAEAVMSTARIVLARCCSSIPKAATPLNGRKICNV